jgi:hypothetical protein
MAEFRDIAEKLAKTTIVPSPAATAAGEIGAGLGTAIRGRVEPFLKQETKETLFGEYAKSPIRIQLAKLTGVKQWGDVVKNYEKLRNEFMNWVPGQDIRVPKMQKTAATFNKEFMNQMQGGESVKIGNIILRKNTDKAGGGFAFSTDGGRTYARSRLGLNENITNQFGQEVVTERPIPGEFVTQKAGPSGRSREQIKKELDEVSALFNRLVPGRSELEAYLQKFRPALATGAGRVGAPGVDKWAMEKYRRQEMHIDELDEGEPGAVKALERKMGDLPFTAIQGYFVKYLRDINNNLLPSHIRAGRAAAIENATVNSFKKLNEELVDQHLANFQQDINKNIQIINQSKNEAQKLIRTYALLLSIAPTAGDPENAVVGAVGSSLLQETLAKARAPIETSFEDGIMGLPRYLDDYASMAEAVLKQRSKTFKRSLKEKGTDLFDRNLNLIRENVPSARLPKLIPIFRRGVSPDSIKDTVRKNLLYDWNLAQFAPRTPEAWKNPTEDQKMWLALFRSAYGRHASLSKDVSKIRSPEEQRSEGFKTAGELGQTAQGF